MAEQSAAAEAALTAARQDAEASATESEARAGELLALHSEVCTVAWSCIVNRALCRFLHELS